MPNFLMVSPYFVPMNFVGAKRSLHMARYLPDHGWRPAVVALPADTSRDPALDALVPEVPMLRTFRGGPVAWAQDVAAKLKPKKTGSTQYTAQARQEATPSVPRGRLAQITQGVHGLLEPIDRFAPYIPWVLPQAIRFARTHRCELVYANAGPFSALHLSDAVARLTGLPLVLDLRDPWSIEPNYRTRWTDAGRVLIDGLELAHFRRASRVILNTERAMEAYREAYHGRIPSARFTCVRNQFDPALYGPASPAPTGDDPFRIIYYGHLRPTKNAQLFLGALARFIKARQLRPGQLEFITLGEVTSADAAAIHALGLHDFVQHHGWLPFTESPTLLGSADVLLDLMGPNHHMQISGKIYDYLASARPILSVSPNTELDQIFAETGAGERVDLDEDQIVAALERAYARRAGPSQTSSSQTSSSQTSSSQTIDADAVWSYTAEPAARRMAEIFNAALNGPTP